MPQEIGQGSTATRAKKRSTLAALFYTVLAIGSFVAVVTGTPAGLIGMVLFGLYSAYLWRGGRVVIFFW